MNKKRKKDTLKIILAALIAIFLMMGAGALLLGSHQRSARKEEQKQAALDALDSIPRLTPTVAITMTPTPLPTATPTPTPIPTIRPAFNPDDYWDVWYSTDGLASVNIYNISLDTVSFQFAQSSRDGTRVAEADVSAEVAGNAAQFSFTDSQGSTARGSFTFDKGQLYVRIETVEQADVPVAPNVNCVMVRERPEVQWEEAPTQTPVPTPTEQQSGEYYFADSNSRYLTDEELQNYSSSELELAKNEIYARHGRIFVTERIADYFNGKSWYQGTVDPETFDAQQSEIFNEYELANIAKILEWENYKREQGQ